MAEPLDVDRLQVTQECVVQVVGSFQRRMRHRMAQLGLDFKGVADRMGTTRQTIYNHAKSGSMPLEMFERLTKALEWQPKDWRKPLPKVAAGNYYLEMLERAKQQERASAISRAFEPTLRKTMKRLKTVCNSVSGYFVSVVQASWQHPRWGVFCEEHGALVRYQLQKDARDEVYHPEKWCEECRKEREQDASDA